MSDRLRLAVENGHVVLPEGNVLVMCADESHDLSFLDKARSLVWNRSAASQSALSSQGWTLGLTKDGHAAAIIFLPRAKDAQKATIRFARCATEGPIIISGDKTNGVEAIYRELKGRAEVTAAWSKAHGKVFAVAGGAFEDWPEQEMYEGDDGWWRAPGVFSADSIDPASQLLVDALPNEMAGRVVDLGAGWGFLSHAIAKRGGVTHIDLVEDDILALNAATANVNSLHADFHHADALTWSPETPVDHVVTNPPFHTGRAADPALGQGFIRSAGRILKRDGTLWLVANRQLPYEATLEETFRDVHLLKETAQFKVYRAERPRARRKG